MQDLTQKLFSLADAEYEIFMVRLLPNIPPETVIGVRTPELRRLAKELTDREAFLNALPHRYFEENQIHAFALEGEKDLPSVLAEVEGFLPYIGNWATCDQLSPKVFYRHRQELLPAIRRWLDSDHAYTIRFGMKILMTHFLDEDFAPVYPQWVADVQHGDYYVKMMQAWYFATALAKQYDGVLPFLTDGRLEQWVHNKTIQKAVESYRISPEQKAYLRTLRRKTGTHR